MSLWSAIPCLRFFIGLSLIYIFALTLKWLPAEDALTAYGKDFSYYLSWLKYVLLPTFTLVFISIASSIRYVRNAMLEASTRIISGLRVPKGFRKRWSSIPMPSATL